jgi:hypothetical protein
LPLPALIVPVARARVAFVVGGDDTHVVNDELPEVFSGDRTGKAAVRAVKHLVEVSDWIYRPQDGLDDFGIDGELEIANAPSRGPRQASGRLAKVQVRGRSGLRWKDGLVAHRVKRRTFNLWGRIGLPVFLTLWDADRNEVFWTTTYGTYPEIDEDPVPVLVRETQRLSRGMAGVREVMDLWQSSGGPVAFETTQAAYESFLELRESAEGDWWLSAGSDLTDRLRRFIAHVDGLALALGVVRPALRSFSAWSTIDRLVRPDDRDGADLHYGTLRLAVGEAGVVYLETLESLKNTVEHGSPAIRDYRPVEASQWLRHVELDHDGVDFDAEWTRQGLEQLNQGVQPRRI